MNIFRRWTFVACYLSCLLYSVSSIFADDRSLDSTVKQWAGDNRVIFVLENTIDGENTRIIQRYFDVSSGAWMIINGTVIFQKALFEKGELLQLNRQDIEVGSCWDGKNLYSFHKSYDQWTPIGVSNSKNVFQALPNILPSSNQIIVQRINYLKKKAVGLSIRNDKDVVGIAQAILELSEPKSKVLTIGDDSLGAIKVQIKINDKGIIEQERMYLGGKLFRQTETVLLQKFDFNVANDEKSLISPKVFREILPGDFISNPHLLGFMYAHMSDHLLITKVFTKSDAFANGIRPWDIIKTINGKPVAGMSAAELFCELDKEVVSVVATKWDSSSSKDVKISQVSKDTLLDDSGTFPVDAILDERK